MICRARRLRTWGLKDCWCAILTVSPSLPWLLRRSNRRSARTSALAGSRRVSPCRPSHLNRWPHTPNTGELPLGGSTRLRGAGQTSRRTACDVAGPAEPQGGLPAPEPTVLCWRKGGSRPVEGPAMTGTEKQTVLTRARELARKLISALQQEDQDTAAALAEAIQTAGAAVTGPADTARNSPAPRRGSVGGFSDQGGCCSPETGVAGRRAGAHPGSSRVLGRRGGGRRRSVRCSSSVRDGPPRSKRLESSRTGSTRCT